MTNTPQILIIPEICGRRATPHHAATFLAACLLCLTFGCGGDNIAPVSGTILLDSKPLPDAYVVFEPVSGGATNLATAKTDSNGHYSLSMRDGRAGCPTGNYKVRLTTVPPDSMDDERSPLPKDTIPKRYQDSPPLFEVTAEGNDQADFELDRR